jgi:hypothetical protein
LHLWDVLEKERLRRVVGADADALGVAGGDSPLRGTGTSEGEESTGEETAPAQEVEEPVTLGWTQRSLFGEEILRKVKPRPVKVR